MPLHSLHAFLSPKPLSPVFFSGSPLQTWAMEKIGFELNEDLTLVAGFILLLATLDICLARPFLKPKARYFGLHVVANSIAAVAAFPDVLRVFFESTTAISGPSYTMVANSSICAIHIYHCIGWRLSGAEIFHHATFVTVLCGLAVPYKQLGGSANNFGCFFLSGLPGGLVYFMLVLVQHGVLDSLKQKYYHCLIDTWMRGPSMTVYAFVVWQAYWTGSARGLPNWALFVVAMLHFTNGQYYAEMAIGNYYYRKAEQDIKSGKAGKKAKEF